MTFCGMPKMMSFYKHRTTLPELPPPPHAQKVNAENSYGERKEIRAIRVIAHLMKLNSFASLCI